MADIFDSLPTPPPAQGAPAGDIFDQVAAKATPTTADLMRSYKPDYKPPQAPPSSWTDQFKPASMFKALAHPIMASVGGLERNIAANLNPSEIAGNDQGDVAPTPLQNTMNAQAQTYGNIQGAPGPATTGLNMLGGIPGVVAGAAPAAIAGLTSAQGEGQNQGASVINAGFNALLAGGATTDFAKAAVSKLGKFMPDIIAKLGVRGITGMGLGSLDQLATNAASGRPLTEGVAKSGAMFAGQELLGGAVHDVMAPKAEPGPTAEGAAAAKANPAGQVQANMEKMAGMDKMRALRDDAQATNAAAATPEVNRTQNAGQDLRVPDSTLGAPKASPEPTGKDLLAPQPAASEAARPAEQSVPPVPMAAPADQPQPAASLLGDRDLRQDFTTGRNMAQRSVGSWKQDIGPIIDKMGTYAKTSPKIDEAGLNWMSQVEKTGQSPTPEHAAQAQDMMRFNTFARDAATRAGTDTSAWNPFWIKRMAKKPSGMSDADYQNRLSGAETYLQARTQPTPQDWFKAITDKGLEPAHNNVADMQAAGYSEVLKSAAVGEQIKKMIPAGDAMELHGKAVPAGWETIPDIIGSHGNDVAIPTHTARALRNILDRSSGDLGTIQKAMHYARYATDTITAQRSIIGGLAEAGAHPIQTARNIGAAFKTSLHPELLTRPEFKPVQDLLKRAASEGGYEPTEHLTSPARPIEWKTPKNWLENLVAPTRWVTIVSNKFVTAPLKRLAAMNLAERAVQHPEWDAKKTQDYLQQGVDTIDRVMGGEHKPSGHSAGFDTAQRLIAPWIKWKTAYARQIAASIPAAAKGNLDPMIRGVIGLAGAHVLLNGLAQLADTKYHTGHAIMPKGMDFLMHRTGEKNADGSERRASVMSSVFPEIEAAALALKGEKMKALGNAFDPAWNNIAQAITGRSSETGQALSAGQRLGKAAGGVFFTPRMDQGAGGFIRNATYERDVPVAADRSKVQNFLQDKATAKSGGYPPETADAWSGWNKLAATPEDYQENKKQILTEMQANPNIDEGQINNAIKRWKKPAGLERSALNDVLGPADLHDAWNMASPDEQAELKKGIAERAQNLHYDKMSRTNYQNWTALLHDVYHPEK